MKIMQKFSLAVLVGICATVNSHALLITAGVTTPTASGPEQSQAAINAILATLIPGSTEVYKDDVGGSESGSFLGSYKTTYGDLLLIDEDFTITYTGGAAITTIPVYLLVKDGENDPSWYLYNLTELGWTGIEDIQGQNFWPGQGGISHVALYAGSSTPSRVPDGGATVLLLGCAMGCLGYVRRWVS